MQHKISNKLQQVPMSEEAAAGVKFVQNLIMNNFTNLHNALGHTMETNIHTHGLHGSPGLLAQPTAVDDKPARLGPSDYSGSGDNVFIAIPPGASVTYRNAIHKDHFHGTHW